MMPPTRENILWMPFKCLGRALLSLGAWAAHSLAASAPPSAFESLWMDPDIGRRLFQLAAWINLGFAALMTACFLVALFLVVGFALYGIQAFEKP